MQGTAANDKTFGEYARYSLARLEEALDLVCTRPRPVVRQCDWLKLLRHPNSFSQDEAALESLVLERGLPSVEFIWYAVSVVSRQTFFFGIAFSHHYRSQARAVATVKPVQG